MQIAFSNIIQVLLKFLVVNPMLIIFLIDDEMIPRFADHLAFDKSFVGQIFENLFPNVRKSPKHFFHGWIFFLH